MVDWALKIKYLPTHALGCFVYLNGNERDVNHIVCHLSSPIFQIAWLARCVYKLFSYRNAEVWITLYSSHPPRFNWVYRSQARSAFTCLVLNGNGQDLSYLQKPPTLICLDVGLRSGVLLFVLWKLGGAYHTVQQPPILVCLCVGIRPEVLLFVV